MKLSLVIFFCISCFFSLQIYSDGKSKKEQADHLANKGELFFVELTEINKFAYKEETAILTIKYGGERKKWRPKRILKKTEGKYIGDIGERFHVLADSKNVNNYIRIRQCKECTDADTKNKALEDANWSALITKALAIIMLLASSALTVFTWVYGWRHMLNVVMDVMLNPQTLFLLVRRFF